MKLESAAELRRLHAANIDCMNHFNALMEERNELLQALKDSDALITQLMPGVKHIALQDYGFLNTTLINNTKAINKATGESK